jgi:hypothetical protein
MRDGDIRRSLAHRLHATHSDDPDTLIRHELGICAGARRIDMAVINGEIAGYEIKSDEDTLTRLSGQVEAYGRVLDRAALVTTDRHLDKATARVPAWWGVFVARQESDTISITATREPCLNHERDPFAVAQLLWRGEALAILRELGLATGLSRKARHYVWLALTEALPVNDLYSRVRETIKARQDWPGGR